MRKKYWVKMGTAFMIIILFAGLFFLWTWLFWDNVFVEEKGMQNFESSGTEISISDDGYWIMNGIKTEHKAIGKDGVDGTNGIDGKDGVNGTNGIDGENGITPTVEISADGYWIINGTKTEHKAIGKDGKDGIDGTDGKDGVNGANGIDGENGITPTVEISADGYWIINGTKTEHKAVGKDGKDGIDGTDGKDGVNGTNGTDGANGTSPTVEISADGYWIINGTKTEHKAVGEDGTDGINGANGINGINGANGSDGNGIAEMKIEDGCLFVRYTNDPTNWINLGKVTEDVGNGVTAEGLSYEKKADGTLVITGYTGTSVYLEIPEKIGGKDVTAIGSGAFSECSNLLRITVPKTVIEINDSAFADCFKLLEIYNLSDLTITAGAENNGEIAKYALTVHTDEAEESILKSEGDFVYTEISGMSYMVAYTGVSENLILPEHYEGGEYGVYSYALYNNSYVKTLEISKGVVRIGEKAFAKCTAISRITLDAVSLETFGINDVFAYSCTDAELVIGKDVTVLPAYLFASSDTELAPDIVYVSFDADSLCTSIDAFAFYNLKSLISIKISPTLKYIRINAFVGTSLGEIIGVSGVWSGDGGMYTFSTPEELAALKSVNNGFERIGG